MGSSRLPGKVLLDLGGRPLVLQLLSRLARTTRIDEIVVATSESPTDDQLAEAVEGAGVRCVRGSEHDVLARYVRASQTTGADVIVRVTGDCPLIDAAIVDSVVSELGAHTSECDYASNTLERSFPRGLDTEALFADTLLRADRLARSPEAREHVTWYLHRERPDLFLLRSVRAEDDHSDLNWSIDTADDLRRVRALWSGVGPDPVQADWREFLALSS